MNADLLSTLNWNAVYPPTGPFPSHPHLTGWMKHFNVIIRVMELLGCLGADSILLVIVFAVMHCFEFGILLFYIFGSLKCIFFINSKLHLIKIHYIRV